MSASAPAAAARSTRKSTNMLNGALVSARGIPVPTWALGLIVALASWFIGFNHPVPGLDPSWGAGLYMALHDGLDFGTEVVFTYGPLGFLFNPIGWYTGLASVTYVWFAVLHIALAVGLVWAIRRTAGALVATLGAFLILCLLLAIDLPFAIAAILCFAALRTDRPRFALEALILAGAPLAAAELLVKLSIGPPLLAMFLLALIGVRAKAWQWAAFSGLFVVALAALWFGTGQDLGNFPDYVSNAREVISGYSEAMAFSAGSGFAQTAGPIAAAVTLIALIAAAAAGSLPDRRARVAAGLVMAVCAFSLFKEGVVRYDVAHLAVYFATAVVFWLAVPWPRSRRVPAIAGAAALGAAAAVLAFNSLTLGDAVRHLNVFDNVERAVTETKNLFQSDERSAGTAFSKVGLQSIYAIPPTMISALQGHTVTIDPWEIAAAWAYDLDWDPLPVFQNYNAYTSELDQLNADAIASPEGPEMILRQDPEKVVGDHPTRTIDGRYPGWDPPAQALAMLCNFVPLQTSGGWQLLGRVAERCSEPRPLGSVESAYGETVDVPAPKPGEIVFVRIHGAEVGGFEAIRSLLYRARFRNAVVNGEQDYRLIPGTSTDGLLLRGSPRLVGTGAFAQAPQAETLELTGLDGDLRYDFYSMKVEAAPGTGGRKAKG